MTDTDDLISRVAAYAASNCDELPAQVPDEQIKIAEQRLGFTLHPLLVRLYHDVADGGFGPDYKLMPLLGPGESVVEKYLEERKTAADPKQPSEPGDVVSDWPLWPRGVVPILTWGCAMYACVDCLDPNGQVLLFEPNAYLAGPGVECWFSDSPSLQAWLEIWLSGTGWYEADDSGHDDPQPWPQAAARLSDGAKDAVRASL